MQKYIVNYKGEKEDNADNIALFFKELLINIFQDLLFDIDITNELFLT